MSADESVFADARAILVTIDLEHPYKHGPMWEGPFEARPDDEPHEHPIARAWALWESIKDDWPMYTASVISNESARKLQSAYRVSAMLGTPYEEALANA